MMEYDLYSWKKLLAQKMAESPSILTTHLDQLQFSWRNIIQVGTWRLGFFLGLCAIVIYFLSRMKELYLPARILWGYALCYAIFTMEFPFVHYGQGHTAFQAWAGMNALEVTLIPLFALYLSEAGVAKIFSWLKWIMLGEILCACTGTRGLLIAPSFNLAFVALYLPFAPLWLWIVGVGAICTHHAGAAQAMLGTYALLWCWRNLRRRYFLGALLVIVPVVLGVAYFHSHSELLDGSERLDRWVGRFFDFWLHGNMPGKKSTEIIWLFVFFGVGPATFMWSSMLIDRFKEPVALFMHNDFIQVFWELGTFGGSLALLVYRKALLSAADTPPTLYALAGLAPFAFFWHPLRFFPTALLVALLVRQALIRKGLSREWESPDLELRRDA